MFDTTNYEKLEKSDAMVDAVRNRFGNDVIMRAAFLDRKER